MNKLYLDVNLETPFMVLYHGAQVQACANNGDTVEIGGTQFIRVTDINGHNVEDTDGNRLLLNDGVIYKVVDEVPKSTNIIVTDVVPSTGYSLTVNCTNEELTDVNISVYDPTWTYSGSSSTGKTLTVNNIPSGTSMHVSIFASGYQGHDEDVVITENTTVSQELVAYPTITLEAGMYLTMESGALTLRKSDDSIVTVETAYGTEVVIVNPNDSSLVSKDTNLPIFDSATMQQLEICPFPNLQSEYSIESGTIPTGYTVTAAQGATEDLTLVFTNMEQVSPPSPFSIEVYVAIGSYRAEEQTIDLSGQTPTVFHSILSGSNCTLYAHSSSPIYAVTLNYPQPLTPSNTTQNVNFGLTEIPHGTVNISFTNSGSITAETANLALEVSSYEGVQNIAIPAADVDTGTFIADLPTTTFESYYISSSSIGGNYTLNLPSTSFSITENETTTVSVTFDITQN